MEWIAKSNPYQSLTDHTQRVLAEVARLKSVCPSLFDEDGWQLLHIAAAVHDLGKVNTRFQNRIREVLNLPDKLSPDGLDEAYKKAGVDQVPHGFLSPAYLDIAKLREQFDRETIELLILTVFRHHLRDEIIQNANHLEDLVVQVVSNDLPDSVTELPFLRDLPVSKPTTRYLKLWSKLRSISFDSDESWQKWVILKGTLNRVDYAASAQIEVVTIPEPGERLTDCLRHFFVKRQMRPVQKYMNDQLKGKNAVVIASTGVGKTEAALLWIGDRQGFYTLPVRTAINAMYRRIQGKSSTYGGLGFKHVSLLHSDALQVLFEDLQLDGRDPRQALEEADRSIQKARLLSQPLTICTVDQLFRFVFKYEGCEPILATLAGSAVVLDEIQMYPPPVLACIISALKTISDIGGRFAIITATFPPLLGQIMRERGIPFETPPKPFLCDQNVRHRIEFIDSSDFDIGQITEKSQNAKVLVIVNTVQRAQEIALRLADNGARVKLLHSRFARCHRDLLEREILKFAGKECDRGEPGVWVTTQVVEASLDVDFDFLYTEMSTAESLFQRMGRVWRHRGSEYSGPPNVYVLANRNGIPRVIDPDLYQMGLDLLKEYDGRFMSEEDKMDLIHRLYDPINKRLRLTDHYKALVNRLSMLNVEAGQLTIHDAIEQFRDIESITVVPESIYCHLEESGLVAQWRQLLADGSRSDRQERLRARIDMMNWSVSIPNTRKWNNTVDYEEAYFKGSGVRRCRLQYSWAGVESLSLGLTNDEFEDDTILEG